MSTRSDADELGGRIITEGCCIHCKGPTTRISMIGRTGTYWYLHFTCEPLILKKKEEEGK